MTSFDSQAKTALRNQWSNATRLWSKGPAGALWLRAQPPSARGGTTHPRLVLPGTQLFSTQPDGLWVSLESP